MDPIGWFIATLHDLLGHDKAAAFIGVPPGDRAACVICRYDRTYKQADRQAVIDALAPVSRVGQPGSEEDAR